MIPRTATDYTRVLNLARSLTSDLPNDVVRIGIAIFLLITAILKALDPAFVATFAATYEVPAWAVIAAVQVEFFFSFLLLLAWKPRLRECPTRS